MRFWIDVFFRFLAIFQERFSFIRRGLLIKEEIYGQHRHEKMDVIMRNDWKKGKGNDEENVIVYVHGGAWWAVTKDIIRPYFLFLAHGGCKVYNVHYPLAPECKFPTALISILKVLQRIKKNHKHSKVILMGDSAGGNLCTMVAMLLNNRDFMKQLKKHVTEDIDVWDYPEITKLCVLYGLVDQQSLWAYPGFVGFCCQLIMRAYQNPYVLEGKFTPLDFPQYLQKLPPTFVLISGLDPLYESNRRFAQVLRSKGLSVQEEIYEGEAHGFVSFLFSKRRYEAQTQILNFIRYGYTNPNKLKEKNLIYCLCRSVTSN